MATSFVVQEVSKLSHTNFPISKSILIFQISLDDFSTVGDRVNEDVIGTNARNALRIIIAVHMKGVPVIRALLKLRRKVLFNVDNVRKILDE